MTTIPAWVQQLLHDIKASRAYPQLTQEIKDNLEAALRAEPVEPPPPVEMCVLCGGAGCTQCQPATPTLQTPPDTGKVTPLEALERDAPEDLAAARRLLLTEKGFSAKSLGKETGNMFAVQPRAQRILDVFYSEVEKVGAGRYRFKNARETSDGAI